MDRYPNISDHGLIGDLHTAALVSTDGTIDWFCSPRFDSPSIFASLLDADKGGFFSVRPETDNYVSKQLYQPNTAILITRFLTPDGVGEVIDFMPVVQGRATDRHVLVRLMRVVRGTMRFVADFQPRFDYGRKTHEVHVDPERSRAVFTSDGLTVTLHRAIEPGQPSELLGELEVVGDGIRVRRTLNAGERAGVVMVTAPGEAREVPVDELRQSYDDTVKYWRDWLGRSTYHGRWREMVSRSAMTLKLMTYEPTGALVAAPTAGLPEQVGGERNWDYRYTWIRDASFSVYSLLGLGYVDEAAAFAGWLKDRVREQQGNGSGPLRIMYRIDGSPDLREETLDHLEGYRGSYPVRIGNDASGQLQLDIYGEAMDAIHLADMRGLQVDHDWWVHLTGMIDWLCDNWRQPEEGIWETRGGRQEFTYGRFMSWVAFDRAVRLAQQHGRPAALDRWIHERDNVYSDVMTRGFHPTRRAFVQHYNTDVLDASLLLMPLLGFVAPRDPMWLSTLDAMDKELVSDSLVYRYNPEASPDGLRGSEGTFSLCSFFYVDALARSGRLEEAEMTFEKMMTYGNHLGLFSEEIGLTGEQLGNFPQAFSHLALINAAVNLDYQLDHGASVVEGVTAR